jgi:hypothetical protein
MDWGTANYFAAAPLVTSFKPNTEGVGINDTLSVPFYNTTIEVLISQDADGKIVYSGNIADGSGTMTLTYDPENKIFDFEEIYLFEDRSSVINFPGEDHLAAIVSIKMHGVTLNSDYSFHSKFEVYEYTYLAFTNGQSYTALQGIKEIEIYHGPINAGGSDFTGTGFALYQYKGVTNPPLPGFDQPPTFDARAQFMPVFDDYANWSNGSMVKSPVIAYYNESTKTVTYENFVDTAWHPKANYPNTFADFATAIPWSGTLISELP